MRITKVTTKTGDTGQTGLGNGKRISKNSLRVNAMGAVDKLNSIIGWARVESNKQSDKALEEIQQDLFNLGGELAIPDVEMNLLKNSRIDWLGLNTEEINSLLPPLNEFILPGGSEFTARIHIARSECRDAERALIALSENEYVPDNHKKYINRLSDFFFVLSRIDNYKKGQKEIVWNYK
ncbi:MAG: ATP:cob(I)alamin adenosyltransferase [bacterium TMED264]|nr:MAG: ATP:cob(I)alamin adenosyltransferase [bacterium TMED264]|tara:strand:+ start:3282 stop:3821 length:540 start_codon:yes stop_codon:yes gene_type:complete